MRRLFASVPRVVVVLGIASFLTDVSSEMIYPLMPEFLAKVLGATALSLGLIEGLAESTAALFKIYAGLVTDRSGKRKPLILGGYTLSGLVRPLIGLAPAWGYVLAIRFTDRIGKGLRSSPRDTLIAESTEKSALGRAYGFQRGMDHAGSVLGPLVAGALIAFAGLNLRQVFVCAVVPAILTVVVLAFGVKEAPKKADARAAPTKPPLAPLRDFKRLTPALRRTLLVFLVFTLGNSTDAFLLLRLTDAGVPTAWIGVLWSLQSAVKMLGNAYLSRWTDRFGARPMLLAGFGMYAATYLAFATVTSIPALIATFLLYGIYYGLAEPAERVLVANAATPELRGTAFGFFHLTVGLGALPASLLFGALWTRFGMPVAFVTGAALSALAMLLFMSLGRGRQIAASS